MPDNRHLHLANLLNNHRAQLVEEWLEDVLATWGTHYPTLTRPEQTRRQMQQILDALAKLFTDQTDGQRPEITPDNPLNQLARELSSSQAKIGFRPSDTASFVISLKNLLTRHLVRQIEKSDGDLAACLAGMDGVLDRLSLMTFDAYVEARERIIAQQSLSLVELSSPVVRLWDQIILLPLVGVIDTVRARQFTERLLESIARFEARVTIIDVTGVPVFDTGVAKHIMKAIDAAQLLGTSIVMTGLSPEGAQTLTKLSINFAGITSRASLRAGFAEALKLVGRRIVASGDGS